MSGSYLSTALLQASATAFQAMRLAGVVFLLWMAWQAWRGTGALAVEGRATALGAARLIREGVALNLLNPKLTVFFLAFLPQFVPMEVPNAPLRMTGLALVFMVLTFTAFVIYGAFASALRNHVLSQPPRMAWLRRSFAVSFAVLGLRLALVER